MPKLVQALTQDFVLNPAQQDLEPFHWATAWDACLSSRLLAQVLDTAFFPKFHQVLYHWLSHQPDFDEVTRWFAGWRGMIPQDVLDQERIRAQLAAALNAINTARAGGRLQPPRPAAAAAPSAAAGPSVETSRWATASAAAAEEAAGEELSFRELVEHFAAEHGIAFLPKAGRLQDGLPVYGFGPISVVMDGTRQVLRAHNGEKWVPVSLDQLLAMHETKLAARPGKRN